MTLKKTSINYIVQLVNVNNLERAEKDFSTADLECKILNCVLI